MPFDNTELFMSCVKRFHMLYAFYECKLIFSISSLY